MTNQADYRCQIARMSRDEIAAVFLKRGFPPPPANEATEELRLALWIVVDGGMIDPEFLQAS